MCPGVCTLYFKCDTLEQDIEASVSCAWCGVRKMFKFQLKWDTPYHTCLKSNMNDDVVIS